MINPHRVAELLSNLIFERLSLDDRNNTDSKHDEEVAKHLHDHVESILESSQYSFESEHTIDFNDDSNTEQLQDNEEEDENDEEEEEVEEDDEEDEQQQMNNDDEQFDEEFMEVDNDQHHHLQKEFSIPYMKQAIDFYDQINDKTGRKSHSWKAFQHRFPKVKNRSFIERFRKYLESSGTKNQKLDQINQYTYNKFKKARSEFHFVHDIHLKRWALQKAREINDRTSEASDSWILHFKRRHALCSRKVTKLITQREVVDADTINDSVNDFVNKIKKLLPHYRGRNVLNTDQTGLEIEMVGNRTLSFKGEKATFGKVRSVHNTSHSYTVQFITSLTDQPIGKWYLCLKEKNGHMSDNIKKDLFQASRKVDIVSCRILDSQRIKTSSW
ncbi:unnamed protein product [Didymodactylos carnosus]|uniref:Transposase n=3 Tax=Didymodactylos carnosus TaxID=1234261 RepID=A0A8S2F7I6_9BILA|nr:unnamed protein product [Didymodactylos carnosus]CAF4163426.1 unnamed protein product [Didymodactylos carnosus]